MGVSGLLPVLKPIQDATTLERYRGKTLAIDTYAWLHKASFCCAEDLVLERPTKAYINYFNKRIEMLRHFNIKPYFVFDGDYLPSKGNTEKEREIRRNEYKQLAIEAKKNGNSKLAFNYYQKACDISPEMAKSVINELKIKFIKYIVAPYEADSQMVMLEKLGLVDGIISEDSDLLIFGCKTLITKLNDKGQCIEIKRDNFNKCKGSYINNFNDDQLLLMATISGCDYTKGIPGIGIQKAIQLTQSYKTYERVLMSIKVDGKNIPNEFEEEFKRAKIAFRHQIVFNPINNLAQHLNPLTEEIVSNCSKEYIQSCTGFILEEEIHKKISIGELDPFSKKVLISWECKVNPNLNRSASLSLPIENNISTNHSLSKNMIYRSKTENIIQSKGAEVQPILNKKRKSTVKIDQFAKFISTKRENNNNNNNNNNNDLNNSKLSPISKRQKLLNNNEIGQPTISKFFNNTDHDSNNNDEKDKIKIRTEEFTASSSDIEDITEEEINEFNMKLNESIGYKNKNKNDSSDIKLSESDEDAGETDNDNFLPSETEIGDIDLINSSEISESTITTMDKTVNKHTPISLMMNNSSISLSTDPGDVNIECYIDGDLTDKGVVNDNEVEDISEDHIVDKSNLLAEIYSFKPVKAANITAATKKNILNDENKQYNTTNSTNNSKPFAPNKWMDRLSGIRNSKVHRPSPLNKRIPLQDVTTNVNMNSNNTTTTTTTTISNKEKENNINGTNNLSSFRYTGR